MQSEGHATLSRIKSMQSEGHVMLSRIKSMQSEGHAMLPQIKSMQSEGHTTLSQIKSMQSEGHATLSQIKSMQSEGHAMLSRIILYRPCRTGIGQTRGLSLHAAYRPSPITFPLPIRLFFTSIRAERSHNIFYDLLYLDIYTNSGGTPACRDRPRVCPIPMPIRSTDRITYFAPALWSGICRAEGGQQITPRGNVPTYGLSAEWETLLNRTHTSFNIGM